MAEKKKGIKKKPVTEAAPKKRGRPVGSKNKPKVRKGRPAKEIPFVDVPTGMRIASIPLKKIDLEDTTFRFRVAIRVGDLAKSIQENGQQLPVMLRTKEDGRLQVISGFRRLAALQNLGWDRVRGVVRPDLDDDVEAAKVSILENEARHTYSDLDRAYAILAYREMGKSLAEVQEIFQVGERQRERLEQLTTFPEELQGAVAEGKVTLTHAVVLMQHVRKHPETKVQEWIDWIAKEDASYRNLNAALREAIADKKEKQPIVLYVPGEKEGRKSIRIRPVSIDETITPTQKRGLLKDLEAVTKFVKGL